MFELKKIGFFFLGVFATTITLYAQHESAGDEETTETEKHLLISRENKIRRPLDFFTKGTFGGHVRASWMGTSNFGELSDYHALALGAKLAYQTAEWKGLSIGISGLFTFNVWSNKIWENDPIAKRPARLEVELFDVNRPDNRHDLDRLDELFLRWRKNHSFIQAGRITFYSPLMNAQDTRMKPYAFQGIYGEWHSKFHLILHGGYIYQFSPRGSVEWYNTAESIGIYSQGFSSDGKPGNYADHIWSDGVAIMGATYHFKHRLKAQIWNYSILNISNTLYGRIETIGKRQKIQPVAGVEYLYQTVINHGGNSDVHKTYFEPGSEIHLGGLRMGIELNNMQLTLNGTYIGGVGRFTFPREWGREQFFATLPRGRMEGLGKAAQVNLHWRHEPIKNFTYEISGGRTFTSGSKNYLYNKYQVPSHWNLVADVNYSFEGILKGFKTRLVYVAKLGHEPESELRDLYYITDFHHLNLITQFTF